MRSRAYDRRIKIRDEGYFPSTKVRFAASLTATAYNMPQVNAMMRIRRRLQRDDFRRHFADARQDRHSGFAHIIAFRFLALCQFLPRARNFSLARQRLYGARNFTAE